MILNLPLVAGGSNDINIFLSFDLDVKIKLSSCQMFLHSFGFVGSSSFLSTLLIWSVYIFRSFGTLISCCFHEAGKRHLQFRRCPKAKDLHSPSFKSLCMQMTEALDISQMFLKLHHGNMIIYFNVSEWLCRIWAQLNLSSLQTGICPLDQDIHIHKQLESNNWAAVCAFAFVNEILLLSHDDYSGMC